MLWWWTGWSSPPTRNLCAATPTLHLALKTTMVRVATPILKDVSLFEYALPPPLPLLPLAPDRIQKRLLQKSSPQAPPPFSYCHAPFSPLPKAMLLSREHLISSVCADMEYLVQEAKSVPLPHPLNQAHTP